ncbi:DUF6975 family protein [uncultured Sphingomonas sp.]|uniref:DUF6975 family protein n=1 Tax=uncultured Sphingomonas sp. TaxID=158754 RepID=UPI0035CBAE27
MGENDSAKDRDAGWNALVALVDADGGERHDFVAAMRARQAATSDLADTVHLLCALHGRHPGLIDHAAAHCRDERIASWLRDAAATFAGERAFLARLTAAAGPIPSTPGQAECEAAVAVQRHALDMLAQSDRNGTAVGAVFALLLDWRAIRGVLDAAATRAGLMPPPMPLPDVEEIARAATLAPPPPSVERAMCFGAQQLLAQHRALWDLAEARHCARDRA